MADTHTIEFWPYVRGFKPEEAELYYLDRTFYLQDQFLQRLDLEKDAKYAWRNALKNNPNMKNNIISVIRRIENGGKRITVERSEYSIYYWIKTELSYKNEPIQEKVANRFPFATIMSIITTADGFLILKKRPANVPAETMILPYPYSHIDENQQTLADIVNLQFKNELGFDIYDKNRINNIESIGMARESDEYTPAIVFHADTKMSSDEIKPVKNTKEIKRIQYNLKNQLIDRIAGMYTPTVKIPDKENKLVPNGTTSLALFVREFYGEKSYERLITKLTESAKGFNVNLKTVDYNSSNSPF